LTLKRKGAKHLLLNPGFISYYFLALMEVEILLFFSLKNKRLQRTAGTSSKKSCCFKKL
jgi:hypothetical protein